MSAADDSGKKIWFYPYSQSSNKYTEQMQKAVVSAGYELCRESFTKAFFKCDVFHYNWYETVSHKGIKGRLEFCKKLVRLVLLKALGKKIVYTLHNKTAHTQENRNRSRRFFGKWFMKHADRIIIHCRESVPFIESIQPDININRIQYVPHPNYISAYTGTKSYTNYSKKPDEILLLFLGSVIPIKNLDIIIRTADNLRDNSKLHFLLCGRGKPDYCNELNSMITGDNITADFRFIDDDEIPSLMSMADAVMLPYSTVSELNSGASYLAFSFGKTVIGTWTGTTRDIDASLVYCYDDTDDKSKHVSRLTEAITRFCRDFMNGETAAKGSALLELMKTEYSVEETAEALKKAYTFI